MECLDYHLCTKGGVCPKDAWMENYSDSGRRPAERENFIMRVVIQENYGKMCKWAADYIAAKIKNHFGIYHPKSMKKSNKSKLMYSSFLIQTTSVKLV